MIFLVKSLGKPSALADRSHCTQSLAMLPFGNTFSPLFFHWSQKLHLALAKDNTEKVDAYAGVGAGEVIHMIT